MHKPSVSLIIPIYNESRHLKRFLECVDTLDLGRSKELVLIDDCSKDDSFDIVKSFPFKSKTRLEKQPINRGKGAAIRTGIELATGEVLIIQDADFEYDMRDLAKLLELFDSGDADIVYGSRFKKTGSQVHRTFHYLVNRFLTILSNALSGLYLSDMETCYKLFSADILKNVRLETDRFGFEPEITAKIAKMRVRVHELPIRYFPRNYLEGKKINWKDGVAAVFHTIRFNLFRDSKSSFLPTLPDKYKVEGRQWL